MIDTIVAFGCSHTQGDESVVDYNINYEKEQNIFFAYPFYLSKILNCKYYYNYAVCGSSNQQIASTFFEKIEKFADEIKQRRILIVIGWTCNNRITAMQYTEKSHNCLRSVINALPILKRITIARKIFQNNQKPQGIPITITSSIIRLITRLRYKLNINKKTRQCRTINEQWYYEKIKPYFSDDFIIGIDKHIFYTAENRDTNTFIELCIDQFLTSKKIPYIAVPMMSYENDVKNIYFNNNNNIVPKDFIPHNLSFIQYYGEKYGMSESGSHMKAHAHEQFANFLYNEIQQRKILSV
jgi:hypothetical protein